MTTTTPTVWQQAEGLAEGRLDPVTLTETALERAASADAVFISRLTERARFEADQARQRQRAGRRLGPLDGIPMAWKDLFDIAGSVTTSGSRLYDRPASTDAEAVRLAGQAGLISIGKTNMTELAYSGLGLNPHYGTPQATPGDGPARVPGGSSSGSAVAVAAGIVAAAAGSDTAGSLRIPAAFNGLVSYRPSVGRPAMAGVHPLARSMDTVGVLAATLEDVLAVDDAMRLGRVESRQPRAAGDIRLVLDEEALHDAAISEPVRANLLAAARRFEAAGVRVLRRPVPAVRDALAAIAADGWLGGFEAYTEYKSLLESRAADFDPRVRDRLLSIQDASPDRVVRLYWTARRLRAELRDQLDGALLLSPTVAQVAPELAPLQADDARYTRVNLQVLRLTMVASLLDCPAVALPSGTDADGQYTSVQLAASNGGDEALVRSALTLDQLIA